jgi:hypothetical protein
MVAYIRGWEVAHQGEELLEVRWGINHHVAHLSSHCVVVEIYEQDINMST